VATILFKAELNIRLTRLFLAILLVGSATLPEEQSYKN
jgi:hypothetical protein